MAGTEKTTRPTSRFKSQRGTPKSDDVNVEHKRLQEVTVHGRENVSLHTARISENISSSLFFNGSIRNFQKIRVINDTGGR